MEHVIDVDLINKLQEMVFIVLSYRVSVDKERNLHQLVHVNNVQIILELKMVGGVVIRMNVVLGNSLQYQDIVQIVTHIGDQNGTIPQNNV